MDIDQEKVNMVNSKKPPIYEKGLQELLNKYVGKNLRATTDYDEIKNTEVTFICVGTPSNPDGSINLSIVKSASESIGLALRDKNKKDYHVVVVKSTVVPETTEKVVAPIIRKYNNNIGFVMNPEFLREGNAVHDFMNPDRIVIGSTYKKSGDIVEQLYKGLDAPIIRTNPKTAEMVKYTSNSFLATKISFTNEIGNICKELGIDVYEVMKAVGLDFRISPYFLNAGVGYGGSCFPKDVKALIHKAKFSNRIK
ncbi:MAG: nucleotide sugar dehydrogenase [Methanosarcinales archaeon]